MGSSPPTTRDEHLCEGDGRQRRLVPAEGGLNIFAKRDMDGHSAALCLARSHRGEPT